MLIGIRTLVRVFYQSSKARLTPHSRIESLEKTLKALMDNHQGPEATSEQQATAYLGSLPRSVNGTSSLPHVPPPSSVRTATINPKTSDNVATSITATLERLYDHVVPRLVSTSSAERLLLRFTTAMTPHFPFVVLPLNASLDTLQQERPLLLLAILAAAAYDDIALQRRLGKEITQTITYIMLHGTAMSLEILQALLVHLAWYVLTISNAKQS
jgi:hypothetical protein